MKRVAILTSGGLAPCLSASVGCLISRYTELDKNIDIIGYVNGYIGLLTGEYIRVTDAVREDAEKFLYFGGSPLGNSRVKLSNASDCEKNGFIRSGENPFEVAANQLIADGVDVLHTIGGDDTSTTAAELAYFLKRKNYDICIVGLPKTIDNDIFPIQQSLGADTAAEQGAIFFENVVHEISASPGTIVVHEVMGRHCGWLTYATAKEYMERLNLRSFSTIGFSKEKLSVHGIYIPEAELNLDIEIERLSKIFNKTKNLNLFVSEGSCAEAIVAEMEAEGKVVHRDAFGHVKLDSVNAGKWIGAKIQAALGAKKLLVQKSGYFARSAIANIKDLRLIQSFVDFAVDSAFDSISGVVGHDTTDDNTLRCIDFSKIKGGRLLDLNNADVKAFMHQFAL